MKTHAEIIDKLGGIRKLARALNHTSHTTVQGWYERSKIPVEHWEAVIAKSGDLQHQITVSDMLPPNVRKKADKAAASRAQVAAV